MTAFKHYAALAAATAILAISAHAAQAQTVLRLDEVPVGELDPAKASDYADSLLMFNAYDTLVMRAQGEPGLVPHLAESWEADGDDWVFKLRGDVKFQSGNPLTAEDVVFSFDRMKALGQGLSYLFENVDSAEAVDETTVKFNLSQPYSPFVAALIRLPIVDKAAVMENLGEGEGEMGDWGEGWLAANSAGTGAYRVTSHNPQQETLFEKNPDYFIEIPAAAPDQVRLRYGLEAATVRTLVTTGEHDITSQWLPPEVLRSMAQGGAQLLNEAGGGALYIKMNTTKAPLDDVNCRLALTAAFDYQSALRMVEVADGVAQGSPASGAIPVGMLGANAAGEPMVRDMDAARTHLEACKYDPSDYTLELSWIAEVPIEERYALLMQANFQELGFKSQIQRTPWALYTEQVTNPETTPHVSQIFANAVTGDPDTLLYSMYHSTSAGTWQSPENLNDPQVDEYLDLGRSATTEDERAQAYRNLNARLLELAPTIYAYDRNSVFAASDRVSVPALSDPAKSFGMDGLGFTFRLVEMTGAAE